MGRGASGAAGRCVQRCYIFVAGIDISGLDADSVQESARCRMLIPGRALRDRGKSVEVWSLPRMSRTPSIGRGDRVYAGSKRNRRSRSISI